MDKRPVCRLRISDAHANTYADTHTDPPDRHTDHHPYTYADLHPYHHPFSHADIAP